MKITYTKPTINTVPFSHISTGGCFIDHDGEICMKVLHGSEVYAVCFSDKRVHRGDTFTRNVQPVEVELIVHAEEPQ